MKLYLLNTMKNKEPRKISLTFLGFFYHFLQLFKVPLKKKKEKLEQCWAPFDFSGPGPGETCARLRPRWGFCRNALGVLANWEWVLLLFHCVADGLQKRP
jgi:hypothetical protein